MKGSYQLDSFTENKNSEVTRLQAQVELFFEKEFENYLEFGLSDGMNIIECGSGPGFLLKNILKELPACRATALEVDPYLVEILEENSKVNNARIYDVRHASIYNTGLPDNTFDFAIARLVIEHLQDPLAALREMHRILKPGGKIAIVSNDFAYHLVTFPVIPELDDMYRAYCKSRFSEGGNPLAGRQIPNFLRKSGFTGIRLEVINVHSELKGDKALLQAENVNISKSLVTEGFLAREELDQLAAAWYNMLKDPDHVIYRQLFMSCGEKTGFYTTFPGVDSSLSGIDHASQFSKLTEACDEITISGFLKNHVRRIMCDENLVIDEETRLCDVDIDSIGAAELSSIIKSGFNKNVSISDILQKFSIDDLTRIILGSGNRYAGQATEHLSLGEEVIKDEIHEISVIQEQFWILSKMFPQGAAYNISSVLKMSGKISIEALEHAINKIINRHEALRSSFTQEGDSVFQRVHNDTTNKFRLETIHVSGSLTGEGTLERIMTEVHKPFDLSEWPLFRIKLFAGENESILTVVFHHIIVDLRSRNIFSDELGRYYKSFLAGQDGEFSTGGSKYSDYSRWQKTWLTSREASAKLEEWENELRDSGHVLQLPSDFPKPRMENQEGKRKYFQFNRSESERISRFAADRSVNPFTAFLAAYSILLYRISGQQKFVVGVPLTNRRRAEFTDTFGCFVNIVPLAFDFSGAITVNGIVSQARQALLRAHRKQEIPFLKLNKMNHQLGRSSLFQTGFTMENPMVPDMGGVRIESLEIDKTGAQLDLFLTLWENEKEFRGYLEYSTRLFKDQTAERFANLYSTILSSMTEHPDSPVSEINIVSPAEAALICKWNDTEHEFSDDTCIHRVFEQQAGKTPDLPAILFGNSVLTYSEFDAHINRLANHLIDCSVKVEDIVCVCLERSRELLVAIYAIHKAGGAYLPVDPAYPKERIGLILDDAKPVLILTNRKSERNIPGNYRKIYLDNILESPLSDNAESPAIDVKPHNLAYLMYTSGSTGMPKGVMIEHRSVINKLEWMQHQHPLGEKDTILFKTPVTFDVSAWELFWWIFGGAKLAVLPVNGEKDPGKIIEEIETKEVTTVIFVPSMFSPFVDYVKTHNLTECLNSLKWIIQIGEALSPALVNNFNELLTSRFNPLMVNTYGPTEATIAVSWYNCPKEKNVEKIFIGKPIYNTMLLVLNSSNRIQPVGVPGELVITGVNLSRGYLNRPGLNNERFIYFDYLDGRKIRGYRTGDLVKWESDGNIDFIGRIDSQIKLRGHRIELGEIEAKLDEFPKAKNSAVIVKEAASGEKIIVGYVALKEKGSSNPDEIRNFLSQILPEYMIPAHLVILDDMPLNSSGKIDRKSLPEPDLVSGVEMVRPDSFYEKELLDIYSDILKIGNIGITHNFFDMGGNSLLAIRIVNEIKGRLNCRIEPLDIMEFPDIRRLARHIADHNGKGKQADPFTERGVRKQDFSKLQERRRPV